MSVLEAIFFLGLVILEFWIMTRPWSVPWKTRGKSGEGQLPKAKALGSYQAHTLMWDKDKAYEECEVCFYKNRFYRSLTGTREFNSYYMPSNFLKKVLCKMGLMTLPRRRFCFLNKGYIPEFAADKWALLESIYGDGENYKSKVISTNTG